MTLSLLPTLPKFDTTGAGQGCIGTFKALVEKGAMTGRGDTPLHLAVTAKEKIVCDLLLNVGADPTAINEDGETPISLAVDLEANDILESLLRLDSNSRVCCFLFSFIWINNLLFTIASFSCVHGISPQGTCMHFKHHDTHALT